MSGIYDRLFSPPHKGIFVLVDPDRDGHLDRLLPVLKETSQVRGVLVGGSFLEHPDFCGWFRQLRAQVDLPLILFPGSGYQLCPEADAVLYLSLISGRNPRYLIEEQVRAAPRVRAWNLEAIPTAYLLVGDGTNTSVAYVTQTQPIPARKVELVVAHALAARYLGFRLIYLEAGSGAATPIPPEVVRAVRESVDLPLMVGGGLRTPEDVEAVLEAGADFVVLGTVLEENPAFLSEWEKKHARHV